MEKFEVNILGCGSALPTTRHMSSSQVVNFRDKLFMIDCGEGAQIQFRRSRLKFSRLNHIFISHLHGDHCFGLIGLISTMGLLGRTADLHIYAPDGLEKIFNPLLDYFCNELCYKVVFHTFDISAEVIYEDRSLKVSTIPLKHRIPCCGFLFQEKRGLNHLIKEKIEYYNIPVSHYLRIKNGFDFVTPQGDVIANSILTTPADEPRSYAYCSDTIFRPSIVELIKGANLLFHEATFLKEDLPRAKATYHSIAAQAARIADEAKVKKLVIGHFSARYKDENCLLEEAQQVFPNTILANENLSITVE